VTQPLAAAGPLAALTGAAAADLLAAVARRAGLPAVAAQASALAVRLRSLSDRDAAIVASARTALAGAGAGGDARRDFALGQALDDAATVPFEIAEACADVAALGRLLAPDADASEGPDAEAAARLAEGAAKAAAYLVEVNLVVNADDERLARARAAAGAA
jgi:formiminotetrahydrofolate cyclodeaminase